MPSPIDALSKELKDTLFRKYVLFNYKGGIIAYSASKAYIMSQVIRGRKDIVYYIGKDDQETYELDIETRPQFLETWNSSAFYRNCNSFVIVSDEGLVLEKDWREAAIIDKFFKSFYPRYSFRLYWIGASSISTIEVLAIYKKEKTECAI